MEIIEIKESYDLADSKVSRFNATDKSVHSPKPKLIYEF